MSDAGIDPATLLARLDAIGTALRDSGHALALLGLGSVGLDRERLVWAGEGQPVDDHQLTRLARHVDTLPERHDTEETARPVVAEPADEDRQRLLALEQDRQAGAGPEQLRGLLGGFAGGEETEGTTTQRRHQLE